MKKWRPEKLGDIAEVLLGKMLDKEKNKGEPHPYLSNKDVRWGAFNTEGLNLMRFEADEHERFGLRYGDLVVCEGGEPGRCAIWREEVADMKIQKALHRVRVNEGYSNEFVYYRMLLAGRTGGLDKYLIGSTIKHLTGVNLKQVEFDYPPYEEQKRIASVLSALDAKIALNTRINAELEALAKLVYDYWFVQFDFPISAAQAKRMGKPELAGKPFKSSGGAMVYNKELKREVPEGWEVGSLLDIAEYENGLACQRSRPTGSEYLRVIKIREMRDGFTSDSEHVRPDIPGKAVIENGDVLFSWSASLEVMIWAGGKGALNQHIFKVSSEKYPRSFYYHQLRGYLQHFKMMAENRKTTMGHITLDHLEQSRIVIPPLDVVKALDEVLDPLLRLQIATNTQNQELTALRDWLLPLLMNGQVVVGSDTSTSLSASDQTIGRSDDENTGLSMAAEAAGRYGKKKG